MLKQILIVLLIFSLNSVFAQRKKVDTVYVYEKVIVYDTIYVEKPFRLRFADLGLPKISIGNLIIKPLITEKSNVKTETKRKWNFGIEAGIGLKDNIFSETQSGKNQVGENLGVWFTRDFLNSKLTVQVSGSLYHWNSTFDLDANTSETFLDGFYFTEDHQPLLFQKFNDQHLEFVLQLKAFYNWKKFRPFAGVLLNRNFYQMKFLVPETGILGKEENFTSNQNNLGFTFGLQYRLAKKILISVDYQQYRPDGFSLKNSDFHFDIFKTTHTFAERKINLGMSYIISE